MSFLLSEKDLNDYISPGLACTRPPKASTQPETSNEKDFEVSKEPNQQEKVVISLQDCLACSGCITSSEEVLLSRQNHTVFLNSWHKLGEKQLVVSVPPQTRISLAHYFNLSVNESDQCFVGLLRQYFGARYVVGTQLGRSIAIQKTNEAILQRKIKNPDVTVALSSVCPGFVLYVEKTKPELFPFLVNVKSPQQITGSLLRETITNMYHLAIMPCFDKKLEASRKDCEGDVDCVITPREFVVMLEELGIDYKSYNNSKVSLESVTPPNWHLNLHWTSSAGSSSGGYAYQYILALEKQHPESTILTLPGKNSDIVEYRLVDPNNITIGSASEIFGFRNIQNMVRRLVKGSMTKRNPKLIRKPATVYSHPVSTGIVADPYHSDFIEVMACPGGCINGGGLLSGDHHSTRRKQLIIDMNSTYRELPELTIPSEIITNTEYKYKFSEIARSEDLVSVNSVW